VHSDIYTIHVRRGTLSYDVAVTNHTQEIIRQREGWESFNFLAIDDIKEHVRDGRESPRRELLTQLTFRSRPESLRDFLVETLMNESVDDDQKIRAASWLMYFDEGKGFDWIVAKLKTPYNANTDTLLVILGSWFEQTYSLQLTRRDLAVADQIKAACRASLRHAIGNGETPDKHSHDSLVGALCTLAANFRRKDTDDFLVELLEIAQAQDGPHRDYCFHQLLLNHSSKVCNSRSFDFCKIESDQLLARRTSFSDDLHQCWHLLCKHSDLNLRTRSLQVYEGYLRNSSSPIEECRLAIESGVRFTEESQTWLRKQIRILGDKQARAAEQKHSAGPYTSDRFRRIDAATLTSAFANTKNDEVINSISKRIWRIRQSPGSPDLAGDSFEDLAFAFSAIASEPLDKRLQSALRHTTNSLVRCELRSNQNGQSLHSLFKMMHRHKFATRLDIESFEEQLHQEIRFLGKPEFDCHGHLYPDRFKFSMFEKICGVFNALEQSTIIGGSNAIICDLWTLADSTKGEFSPTAVHVGTDRITGRLECSFLWRGKRFAFQTAGKSSTLVPPINAILNSEGVDQNFAVVNGDHQTSFLDSEFDVVLFGPVNLLDALESDFGLQISIR
jgi:hypothetical protein